MVDRGTFVGDALKIITGNVLAEIIAILTAPIITRLFSPNTLGISTLFFSVAGIIGSIVCLRFDPAIILPADDKESANLFAICLVIVSIFTIGTFIIVLFASPSISGFLRAPTLSRYLWLLPLVVFLTGLYSAAGGWNTKKKNFGYFPIAQGVNTGFSASGQIGAGLSGYATSGGLIAGNIFGTLCATLTFLGLTVRDSGDFLRRSISVQGMRKAFSRYRQFPLIDTWSTLLNATFIQLPVFMLSIYFSPSQIGWYGLASLVIMMPASVLGSAINQVFFQRLSRVDEEGQFRTMIEQLFGTIVILGLFPTLVMVITGADLFSVVFGALWREAGIYAQILISYCFVSSLALPFLSIYYVKEKLRFGLIFNITLLGSRFLGLLIGGVLLNAQLAIFLMASAGIMTFAYFAWRLMRLVGIEGSFIRGIVLRNIARFIPAGILLIVIKLIGFPSSIIFGIVCVVLLAYYGYILTIDKNIRDLVRGILFKV